MAYRRDRKALRLIDPEALTDAFLHCETRKVDVVYDPSDLEELTIEYEGYAPWKAKKLVIGERAGKRPSLSSSRSPFF